MTFKKLTPLAVVLSVLIATFIPNNYALAAEISSGDYKMALYTFEDISINYDSYAVATSVEDISAQSLSYPNEINFPTYSKNVQIPAPQNCVYHIDYAYKYDTPIVMYADHSYRLIFDYTLTGNWINGIYVYAIIGGQKYYLSPRSSIIVSDVFEDDFMFGFETVGTLYTSYNDNSATSWPIQIALENASFDITDLGITLEYQINAKIDTTNTWLDNIYNTLQDIKSFMTTWREALEYRLIEIQSSVYNRIGDLMGALQTHFDNLISKLDEEQEEVINGYNNTGAENTNNSLSNSMTDIDNSQQIVITNGTQSLDDYTIPTDGIVSYGTKFVGAFAFVGSCMQAIYDNSGGFTIALSVACTVLIISMLIGLTKFYKE